jgi:hypothetical protein
MHQRALALTAFLIALNTAAFAAKPPLDCSKKSLAEAVAAAAAGETISFTGVCDGPVVVSTDGLTLTGLGTAVIDGGRQDALTIAGAHGVFLNNLEVRNGVNGILGVNGAHIVATGVNVHDNLVFGISLQTASSATLSGVTTARNGLHGLDLQTGSAATITGTFTSSQNRVFGINVNGSSLTFSKATATVSGNALGIQVATASNAFLNDSVTVVNVINNFATGLTVVSGAHLVSFGGTINASGNPLNGVSVNSKGGLDLDAGSQLNAFNNGEGVVLTEASVMTVFNNPQFSQVPGFSTVNSHNNVKNGVRVQGGSTLTLSNQAKVISTQNAFMGLIADNGVGLTLVNSTLTGNANKDLQLTFGTRADLSSLTFGSYTCDATVLVRGTSGIVCPH